MSDSYMGSIDGILNKEIPAIREVPKHPRSIHNPTIILNVYHPFKTHFIDGRQLRKDSCIGPRLWPYPKDTVLHLFRKGVTVALGIFLDTFKLVTMCLWYNSKLDIAFPSPCVVRTHEATIIFDSALAQWSCSMRLR